MNSHFAQTPYQVRFEWGVDGLARLEPADIVIAVDVIRFSSIVSARVAAGENPVLADLAPRSLNGAAVVAAAARLEHEPIVFVGCLRNATAVARAALAVQNERGGRTSIAIVAGGELESRDPNARMRFAVEDQLGAGAIIDALGSLGIDHTSPEAAAAGETFRSLRGAVRHLLGASGSGREVTAWGEPHIAADAAEIDADNVAPVLRDGVFAAFSR